MMIQQLTVWLAPWQSAYSDSKLLSTGVTTVHLVSLFLGGGLAVAADRTTLRLTGKRSGASETDRLRQLSELHAVHTPVLIALAVLIISGLLLAAADVETFATSFTFWTKMGLVAFLMANGVVLQRSERALRRAADGSTTGARIDRLWRTLRRSSGVSLALWVAIVVAGAVLVNA